MKIFLTTFLLFFAAESSFGAKVTPYYDDDSNELVIFTYNKDITLTCNITDLPAGTTVKPTMEWQREGKPVSTVDDLKDRISTPGPTEISGGGYSFQLKITTAQYKDGGNFTCIARSEGSEVGRAEIKFVAKVAVRIKTANINVVEEEKLRIECQALGNPQIKWHLSTFKHNGTSIEDPAEGHRYNITIENFEDENKNTIENGVLIMPFAVKEDRGNYTCIGVNRFIEGDESSSITYVRVKDKYAALWPFLGICAEVVVLCAVIIIYEKKRNKTELEESDTDQSPDQKNTPDHGKQDNLRHRQ